MNASTTSTMSPNIVSTRAAGRLRAAALSLTAVVLAGLTLGACSPRGGDQTAKPATAPASQSQPAKASNNQPINKDSTMNTPISPAPASTPANIASEPAAEVKAQYATFGAGCFWGPELRFTKLDGVLDAEVGYTGGKTLNPTYEQVCNEETGHVEVVRVKFDPAKVSYRRLLEEFFTMHDPTQVNRQGPDYGTQYRTAVFANTPEQAREAEAFKVELGASGKFKRPIATSVEPAQTFYRAEDYHQDYLKKRGIESCGTL